MALLHLGSGPGLPALLEFTPVLRPGFLVGTSPLPWRMCHFGALRNNGLCYHCPWTLTAQAGSSDWGKGGLCTSDLAHLSECA